MAARPPIADLLVLDAHRDVLSKRRLRHGHVDERLALLRIAHLSPREGG